MKWVVLAFLGLATASQMESWTDNNEYSFYYTTSILSGIPQLGRQYAGLKLNTVIKAQKFPDHTIRIQFENSMFKNYNDEIEKGDNSPWNDSQDEAEEVPAAIKTHLEAAFKVVTNEGVVEKILCEDSEPEYITNIKKAAVSGFFALSKSKLTMESGKSGSKSEFHPSVKVMETSIVGECDTYYTVSRLPQFMAREFEQREQIPRQDLCQDKEYYEVIKTKDLKNCKERPIYLHLYGASSISDGSLGSSAPFTDESSVTKTIICGSPESYHVRKAVNEHKYVISPSGKFENIEKMEVTSASTLSVRSVEPRTEDIADVKSPKPEGSLIYEFPSEDNLSSKTSLKSLIRKVGKSDEDKDQEWFSAQVAQPDLTSAPTTLYPNTKTAEQNKEELVRSFLKIVKNAGKSPEGSYSHEDVAGNAVMFIRTLGRLSQEDIKALWTKIESNLPHDSYVKENAYSSFLDLVSICGTNPAIKYIIDVVWLSRIHMGQFKVKGESGAWIISNAIRSVKTPTLELLKELTMLLQHSSVQGDSKLASTVALGLTNLIHKACIHKTSSIYDFPIKTYGRFCDEKSEVITKELIPFLAEKLFTAEDNDINKMIIYINALGNLGHDAASLHLLRVIEGRPSLHPHPRSLAVYQLIRAAVVDPALYRPVILALIENLAEYEEVRMAAITVFPYTKPTSAEFNKLAVRTWWEPSKQVSSYIYSTLKTLSELPVHSRIYDFVSMQAQEAFPLVKPIDTGIQTSHNIMISQFLEHFKSAINLKLEYVTSSESAFPRNVFLRSKVVSKTHSTNSFQSAVYFQGAEYLINKMYEKYSTDKPEDVKAKEDFINNIVRVKKREERKPVSNINVKIMGLQRIFTIDSELVEEIIEEVTVDTLKALIMEQRASKNFLKIIDVNGHNAIIPTECGLPLYVTHKIPLVVSGKTDLDFQLSSMTKGKADITVKPVINYKLTSQAGIFSPFSNKFLGTGVDTSLHVSLPIRAELTMNSGQYSVSLKTPRDEESQKEKPVFHFMVKPYTTNYDMTSSKLVPVSKSINCKTIKSSNPRTERQYPLGKPFGLNLRLNVETEHPYSSIFGFVRNLVKINPLNLFTLSLPIQSAKAHSVSLVYNPKISQTKDMSLVFSIGHGRKDSISGDPAVITSGDGLLVPGNVEDMCRKAVEEWMGNERKNTERLEVRKVRCQRKKEEECKERKEEREQRGVKVEEREECRRKAEGECQADTEAELRKEQELRVMECQMEEISVVQKLRCMEEQSEDGRRPASQIEEFCNRRIVENRQRHSASQANMEGMKKTLGLIEDTASAVSVNMEASLHGENYSVLKKIQTQVTVAKKKAASVGEEDEMKLRASIKTPSSRKPYNILIHASSKVARPVISWDKEALLKEDLTSQVIIDTEFGVEDQIKKTITLDITATKSDEQKAYAKTCAASNKCDTDMASGQRMGDSCKEVRDVAASLDTIQVVLGLPKVISQSPYMSIISGMLNVYFLPYLSVESSGYNRHSRNHDHFKMVAKVAPEGKSAIVSVTNRNQKTILHGLRLGSSMKGLLPISAKESLPLRLIQKVTDHGSPSSCSVEANKVSTFDRVVYDYTLNDCEHVIFKDCTESPKVLVSVRKTPSLHIVRAVIDVTEYELELMKASRGSRAASGKVKVNGLVREGDRREPGKPVSYQDKVNKITKYEDGVFEISSSKYGLVIRADSEATEVNIFQHSMRNVACGLCGDLNDEQTADTKSAQECLMSSPRLAAYSYMVEDRKCAGIPLPDRKQYQRETDTCVRKVILPSKVSGIFHDTHAAMKRREFAMKHMDQEEGQKICISKEQIRVCGGNVKPSEIIPKMIPFFCVAKDQEGLTLQRMVQRGERIVGTERYSTAYTATVYQANSC